MREANVGPTPECHSLTCDATESVLTSIISSFPPHATLNTGVVVLIERVLCAKMNIKCQLGIIAQTSNGPLLCVSTSSFHWTVPRHFCPTLFCTLAEQIKRHRGKINCAILTLHGCCSLSFVGMITVIYYNFCCSHIRNQLIIILHFLIDLYFSCTCAPLSSSSSTVISADVPFSLTVECRPCQKK